MTLESPGQIDLDQFTKIGHNKILYEYHDLDKNSAVLIIGCYKGESAKNWHTKYGCRITAYEPIEEFFNIAEDKLKNFKSVRVINKAVTCDGRSIKINIYDDASHLMELQNYDLQTVRLCESDEIGKIITQQTTKFDLIEVNIEGMEYEVIGKLLTLPLEKLPNTLILQRHKIAGYENLDETLTKQLEEKYECIFRIPYIWERWEKKNCLDLKKESINLVRKHLEASNILYTKQDQKDFDCTFVVVATNSYYNYFIELVHSIEEQLSDQNIQILVFTNKESDFLRSKSLTIRHIFIRSLPWPDITLFRFHLLSKYWDWIEGKIIIWSDADMIVLKPINADILLRKQKLLLSRHPGFSANKVNIIKKLMKLEFKNVLERLSIIHHQRLSRDGWETDRASAAFVPLRSRKIYVQGGFWIGYKNSVRDMVDKISARIAQDLLSGHIPTYHDETYLNWYHSSERVGVLPRDFVIEGTYWWQNNARATILCVDKTKPVQLKRVVSEE